MIPEETLTRNGYIRVCRNKRGNCCSGVYFSVGQFYRLHQCAINIVTNKGCFDKWETSSGFRFKVLQMAWPELPWRHLEVGDLKVPLPPPFPLVEYITVEV